MIDNVGLQHVPQPVDQPFIGRHLSERGKKCCGIAVMVLTGSFHLRQYVEGLIIDYTTVLTNESSSGAGCYTVCARGFTPIFDWKNTNSGYEIVSCTLLSEHMGERTCEVSMSRKGCFEACMQVVSPSSWHYYSDSYSLNRNFETILLRGGISLAQGFLGVAIADTVIEATLPQDSFYITECARVAVGTAITAVFVPTVVEAACVYMGYRIIRAVGRIFGRILGC